MSDKEQKTIKYMFTPAKFLVVEDDYGTSKLMNLLLLKYGLIDSAIFGKEALDKFKIAISYKIPYDIVFLDINLPDINGFSVLEEIRKFENENNIWISNQVKIIMTTSLSDYESINKAFKDNCDGYLIKPIKQADIVEHLKKLSII